MTLTNLPRSMSPSTNAASSLVHLMVCRASDPERLRPRDLENESERRRPRDFDCEARGLRGSVGNCGALWQCAVLWGICCVVGFVSGAIRQIVPLNFGPQPGQSELGDLRGRGC